MGDQNVRFAELPWWKQNQLFRETLVFCRKFMERPGARAFLTDYEARLRREGRLSPLLLAALDAPEEEQPAADIGSMIPG